MQMPKLEQSLFFKQEIMGSLIDQLEVEYIEQNLPFDPTVLDAYSSDKIVTKQMNSQIVIPYSAYSQSLSLQNITFQISQEGLNFQKNREQKENKKYFKEENIKTILGKIEIRDLISQGRNRKYLAVYQRINESTEEVTVNIYEFVTKKDQSILVLQVLNPLSKIWQEIQKQISGVHLISNIFIKAIYFKENKTQLKIEQVLTQDIDSQSTYIFKQTSTVALQKKHLQMSFPSLEQFLKAYHCLLYQLKFLGQEKFSIQDQVIEFQINSDGKYLAETIKIAPIQYKQISPSILLLLMKMMSYLNVNQGINLKQIKIGSVLICNKKMEPFLVELSQIEKSNKQKYSYNIVELANLILQNQIKLQVDENSSNLSESVSELFEQIAMTANPDEVVTLFQKIKSSLQQMLQI